MIVSYRGTDRHGVAQVGQLELEPLELELLVQRRYRRGWQSLEVVTDRGVLGLFTVGRITSKLRHGRRRRVWWVERELGTGQQQLEL